MKNKLIYLTICLLVTATDAHALFIIDTGPTPEFDNRVALGVFDPNRPSSDLAIKFTTDAVYTVTGLETWFLPGREGVPATGLLKMSIYGDLDGPDLNTVYASQNFDPGGQVFSLGWHGVNGLNALLPQGTYWYAMESDSVDHFIGTLPTGFDGTNNPPNPLTMTALCNDVGQICRDRFDPANWQTIGNTYGVRIQGEPINNTVIPEPATLLLFGTGLAGTLLRRRNKRLA